ncbi:LysM peptidoglycan-binding domain-containing protein [Paenibacillus tarimensis]
MKIHIVKQGESLYSIAQKYGVTLDDVIQMNPGIANPDQIDVGMKVKIPSSSSANPGGMEMMHKHSVQQGDTLWKLSKAWGVSLNDMIKANPQLKNPNALLVGEVVNIPKTTGAAGASNLPGTGTLPKWQQMMPKEKAPTAPIAPSAVQKPATAPKVPKVETAPIAPLQLPKKETAPIAPLQVPPAPEKFPKKVYPVKPSVKPHTDLFKQMNIPATEAMAMPNLPQYPSMPFHSAPNQPMPYGIGPSVLDTSNQWPQSLPAGNIYPGMTQENQPMGVLGYENMPMTMPTGFENQPMGVQGYENMPMTMPTGFENQPMGVQGYENMPMTMPTGFENQPMGVHGYENMPMTMPTGFENQPLGVQGYENMPMTMPTGFENQPMGVHGYENMPMTMPTGIENQPMGVHGYENMPMTMPTGYENQPMGVQGYENMPMTAPGAFGNMQAPVSGYPSMPSPGYYPAGYETAGAQAAGWNTAGAAYPTTGSMYPQYGPYGTIGQTLPMTGTGTAPQTRKPCGCQEQRITENHNTGYSGQETSGPKKQAARKPVKKQSAKAKVSSKKTEQKRGSFPWLNN